MSKYERFGKFLEYLDVHRNMGYDNCVAVCGPEQGGKSTFTNQCGIKMLNINGIKEYREFLKNNIGYKLSEAVEEIKKIDKYGFYAIDEAIRGMYKRDWYNAANKELVRIFTQIGMKKGTFFIAIPRFTDLDEFYRNHRIRTWVEIIGNEWDTNLNRPYRFYAVVFERDTNAFNPDPWGMDRSWKYFKKRQSMIHLLDDIDKKIAVYSNCPSFQYYFTFPPLPDDFWGEYFAMSSQRKMDSDAVQQSSKSKLTAALLVKYLREQGKTWHEISDLTKLNPNEKGVVSHETLRAWVNKN